MNILFIINVKILMLMEWSFMLTIETKMVINTLSAYSSCFQTHVFLASVLGATPNHMPLT
jgi:hypothetical protein